MATELGGASKNAAFAQTLAALKEEGSNILLVGETESSPHTAACGRLLGEPDRSRHRLFVDTRGGSCSAEADAASRVVTRDPDAEFPNAEAVRVAEGELLSSLGREVLASVDELEAEGLEPAQLRLCFDSLSPILDDHSTENVFRLLHVVTSRVRQARGMGHFHLQKGRRTEGARLLEPLFDATVEVRGDDRAEHRWHLRDGDVTSEWLGL